MIDLLPDKQPEFRKQFDVWIGKKRLREGDVFSHPEEPDVKFIAVDQVGPEIHILNYREKRAIIIPALTTLNDYHVEGHIWEPKMKKVLP